MVVAWGVLVPTGIVAARFFEVLPRQRFPEKVDSQVWWRTPWMVRSVALLAMAAGLWLVLTRPNVTSSLVGSVGIHHALGWGVLWLGSLQLAAAAFRGTKGGPTDPRGSMRGNHYDLTPRRLAFEMLHKASGYTALGASIWAVLTGMWQANAPMWMWILLPSWWAVLGAAFVALQRRGMVIESYVAIWGPDAVHPGNARHDGGLPGE